MPELKEKDEQENEPLNEHSIVANEPDLLPEFCHYDLPTVAIPLVKS